jgi:hypothetical protein
MTEAEIMEQINTKKTQLENARNSPESATVVPKLEAEIKDLESSLTKAPPKRRRSAFLDECAG